jgi:hypothetical protein
LHIDINHVTGLKRFAGVAYSHRRACARAEPFPSWVARCLPTGRRAPRTPGSHTLRHSVDGGGDTYIDEEGKAECGVDAIPDAQIVERLALAG